MKQIIGWLSLIPGLLVSLPVGLATACDAVPGVEYTNPPEWIEIDLNPAEWHTALRSRGAYDARKEFVRSDQTLQDWRELVAWNVTFGKRRFDIETIRRGFIAALERECKSLQTREIRILPGDQLIEWSHEGCYGRPPQHELMRLISGAIGMHTILYGRKGELSGEERDAWIERLASARLERRIRMEGDLPPLDRARMAVWNGEYPEAVERLQPLVAAGDPRAQELYARLFIEGWGVPHSFGDAHSWFERAAQKLPRAAYQLGRLYEDGSGVEASLDTARSWYSRAADGGDADAMGRLAYFLATASGEASDPERAFELFDQAARGGHGHARYWMAKLIEEGRIEGREPRSALELYLEAAREGERDAQFRLGVIFAEGTIAPQDDAKAKLWLTRAAMQGDEAARTYYRERFPRREASNDPPRGDLEPES